MSRHEQDSQLLAGKRVRAYLRVSKETSQSDRQRVGVTNWGRSLGIEIEHFYCDDQGSNPRDMADKRVDFQQMLRDARNFQFDVLVVFEQDRFGFKDVPQFWAFINELREYGVDLWSVKEGNLSEENAGMIFMATAGALTSSEEVKTKGHRSLSKKILLAQAGQWTGGYPPYGLDVICLDERGAEKWRLVWEAHHRRVRINPDGTQHIYEGKANVPGRDERDIPVFSPSIRAERQDLVRQVFTWFVEENISPSQIAKRLNEVGSDPVFGTAWNKQRIRTLLANPAYIGLPSINKRGGSRYWELVDGQMTPVRSVRGRVKGGRKRRREDHVGPRKPVYEPIVPIEVFEKAQQKIEGRSRAFRERVPTTKAPRVAAFWLRNLLYCANCNAPMRAWNSQGAKVPYRSYMCGTYGTLGKDNPKGCRSNRVKAELLEGLVDVYLRETHGKIVSLLEKQQKDATERGSLADAALVTKEEDVRSIRRRIRSAVSLCEDAEDGTAWSQVIGMAARDARPPSVDREEGVAVPVIPPETLFRYLQDTRRPELEAELSRLNREHTALVDRVLVLSTSPKALEKAAAKIGTIEQRMQIINSELTDWISHMHNLSDDLMRRRRAIQEVQECIGQDGWYRQKAETVKQVISKIIAYFEPVEGRSNQPRTRLCFLEIFPTDGVPYRSYPEEASPGRG